MSGLTAGISTSSLETSLHRVVETMEESLRKYEMVMMKDTCPGGAEEEKWFTGERRLGFPSQKGTTENTGENSVVTRLQINFCMFLTAFPNVSFFWEYHPNVFENLASKGYL